LHDTVKISLEREQDTFPQVLDQLTALLSMASGPECLEPLLIIYDVVGDPSRVEALILVLEQFDAAGLEAARNAYQPHTRAEQRQTLVTEQFDQADLSTWNRRWEMMKGAIAETQQLLTDIAPDNEALPQHLKRTLSYMQAFAEEIFISFLRGFYDDTAKYHFSFSSTYPPNHVLRVLLSRLSTDLSIIQQIIVQRSTHGFQAQGKILDMADRLARRALQPAIELGLIDEETSVVTYLAHNVKVRLIPYDRIILISVPFATQSPGNGPSLDYLSLPHEIGHHLYWHGELTDPTDQTRKKIHSMLEAKLAQRPQAKQWLAWLEEMFADAYGCFVAGPISVLSFQQTLSDATPTNFITDQGEHPISAIRPLIQSSILTQIDQHRYSDIQQALDVHWQTEVTRRKLLSGDIMEQDFTLGAKHVKEKGREIRKQLQATTQTLVEALAILAPLFQAQVIPWASGSDVDTLRRNFQETDPGQFDLVFNPEDPADPTLPKNKLLLQVADLKRQAQLDEAHQARAEVTVQDWLALFQLRGWSTEHDWHNDG
jgi:hypothetical protein